MIISRSAVSSYRGKLGRQKNSRSANQWLNVLGEEFAELGGFDTKGPGNTPPKLMSQLNYARKIN